MSKLEFHDCLKTFFARMYPDIELDSISFYEGLPIYATASPRAITIGRNIYFRESQFDPCGEKGIALIAHELFHIHQGAGGLGFGVIRPFYVWYLIQKVLSGWKSGEQHPVEKPAYDRQREVEAGYADAKSATGVHGPCNCSGGQVGDFSQSFSDAFYDTFEG